MKVAVVCDSILLKKSLEIFLRDRLSDFSTSDVVISDRRFECERPILFVGNDSNADIKKPFGKVKLLAMLENYENELNIKNEVLEIKKPVVQIPEDTMENQLDSLVKEFSQRLVDIVKAHKK